MMTCVKKKIDSDTVVEYKNNSLVFIQPMNVVMAEARKQ